MTARRKPSRLVAVAAVATLVATGMLARSGVPRAQASFEVLHTFTGPDGAHPSGALLLANDGRFYGTTQSGGRAGCSLGCGTVFKMTPDGTSLTVLYAFTGGLDGAIPAAALIQATDGNFYGTTARGGVSDSGTIFRMTRDGDVTILHAFNPGIDGAIPLAALIQATDGNLYGTTSSGGPFDQGTIFTMTLDGMVTVLHEFGGTKGDGAHLLAGLLEGADGDFYGTTEAGGDFNRGSVFRTTADGTVTELVAFNGEPDDGASPFADLIQASGGSFFGTTFFGGAFNQGTVFELSPDLPGAIRYQFTGGQDGARPKSALLQAADGSLYGTAERGGDTSACLLGCGTVFRLMLDGRFTVLHTFTGGNDGSDPNGALIQGRDRKFYGTAEKRGGAGRGVVFRITSF